ncbi:MAG: hypothetical protein FWH22_02775 [Fibromonadales bacterium]|nr:hypothetical protein [Fibromonadales bacterium]
MNLSESKLKQKKICRSCGREHERKHSSGLFSLCCSEECEEKYAEINVITEKDALKKEAKGCLSELGGCLGYLLAFIALIGIIVTVSDCNDKRKIENRTPEETRLSKIKEQKITARIQLEQAIKANLRDPKSYQLIRTEEWETFEYIFVKTEFRSKNAFGGYQVCTYVAQFNFNTKPIEWKITSNFCN